MRGLTAPFLAAGSEERRNFCEWHRWTIFAIKCIISMSQEGSFSSTKTDSILHQMFIFWGEGSRSHRAFYLKKNMKCTPAKICLECPRVIT